MQHVPFWCTFRVGQVDDSEKKFSFRAQCVLCGDLQEQYEELVPENTSTSDKTRETIRISLATASKHDLVVEDKNVNNAYPYSRLDTLIILE